MAAAAGLADVGIGIDHLTGPRVCACCIILVSGKDLSATENMTWQCIT